MQSNSVIIVLSSPSGAGKTSVAKGLLEKNHNLRMSVSATTRPKRQQEVDGKDYHFLSNDHFIEMVANDMFIEHADVFDFKYGSLKSDLDKYLKQGRDVLYDVDWQGARQIKKNVLQNIISIFILPPSMSELENRLCGRNSDDPEVIKRRMMAAKDEITHWNEYDYKIVNDNLEDSINMILKIIEVEKLKAKNFKDIVEKIIRF